MAENRKEARLEVIAENLKPGERVLVTIHANGKDFSTMATVKEGFIDSVEGLTFSFDEAVPEEIQLVVRNEGRIAASIERIQ